MKNLGFIIYVSTILVAGSLMGCSSPEPLDNIVLTETPPMFNMVSGGTRSSDETMVAAAGYTIVFDDDAKVCNITIENLQVLPGAVPVSATFSRVPWNFLQGKQGEARLIEADSLVSLPIDGSCTVTLTDAMFVYSKTNDLSSKQAGGLYARYVVDGIYQVMAYPYIVTGEGTTRISVDGSEDKYDYNVIYQIVLNPENSTASLEVSGMPVGGERRDFRIEGVELSFIPNGYALASRKGMMTVSDIGAEVSDLTATADLGDRLVVDFNLSVGESSRRVSAFLLPNLYQF